MAAAPRTVEDPVYTHGAFREERPRRALAGQGTMLLTVCLIFVSVLLLMRDVPGALGLRPYGVPDNEASDGRGTAAEESLAPEPGTQAGASVKML